MLSTSLLTLAFAALASALPTTSPLTARVCLSVAPTSFTINGFTTFTPAAGNPTPASVSFTYSDGTNAPFRTRCSATSASASNSTSLIPVACQNPAISFLYDPVAHTLTLSESYECCASNETKTMSGSIAISTYCFPSQPPQPNGFGTQCQTPGAGQLSGSF